MILSSHEFVAGHRASTYIIRDRPRRRRDGVFVPRRHVRFRPRRWPVELCATTCYCLHTTRRFIPCHAVWLLRSKCFVLCTDGGTEWRFHRFQSLRSWNSGRLYRAQSGEDVIDLYRAYTEAMCMEFPRSARPPGLQFLRSSWLQSSRRVYFTRLSFENKNGRKNFHLTLEFVRNPTTLTILSITL